jgi:quercetin dioxygenase-like cupin family protein
MKTMDLFDGLEWHDGDGPGRAQALHYNDHGRALRWTLHPGQEVQEFTAEKTPIYIVVLQGQGLFSGADGEEKLLGPNSLIVFDQGEKHSARAVYEDLVLIAILHEAGV